MLHLVPALILLILQGPQGADRAALQARLGTSGSQQHAARLDGRQSRTFASLWALSRDPRISAALAEMLRTLGDAASRGPLPESHSPARNDAAVGVPEEPAVTRSEPILAASIRFRDGPANR